MRSVTTVTNMLLILLVSTHLREALCAVPADTSTTLPPEAPTVTIDMSLDPEEHFKPAVRAVLDRHSYDDSFGPLFGGFNGSVFDALELKDSDYQKLADAASKYYPEEFKELTGISDEFAAYGHDVSVQYLSAWFYIGELEAVRFPVHESSSPDGDGAWFTAAMVADADGTVVHGRNLDHPQDHAPYAKAVTLNFNIINVPHEGVPDYKAAGMFWFAASIETAEVPGHLSMQANTRYYPSYKTWPTKQSMFDHIQEGRVPAVLAYREMIERRGVIDFDEAVDFTSNNLPLSCPVYFAMVGAGSDFRAAVISRDEDGLAVYANGTRSEPLYLDKQGDEANDWYLVQTNYDHWEEDSPSDPRRTVAENCIKEHGKTADVASTTDVVMDCVFKDGVSTPNTIYTSIMDPTDSQITTYVRYDIATSNAAQAATAQNNLHVEQI
ncbi:hypothetical protein FOZ62_028276 [Perkinsus olseni]|uniref:ceramidase n=1 Tax=Perkinsus olseni TaxID=32597 RepID=A0A7J6U583_PEROL|nr:hypothetical protein FOZ62_028276 [Perkinsus olseni]